MFNDILSDSGNIVLVARIEQAIPKLAISNFSTLEEYQTAIYSVVNKVLALQNAMQPLTTVKTGTPALIGDLSTNITNLSNDITNTVDYLSGVESDAANLFNLGELSQTTIRQNIRSKIYLNNSKYYNENFIDNSNIQSNTGTIDNQIGAAYLPLSSEKQLPFSVALGTSSVGSSTSLIANLIDSAINTTYNWNGSTLELILTFSSSQIVNRLSIDLDTYDGLGITSFTASPDGNIYNDILASLNVSYINLDATSGKYSGAVIVDFPPQYAVTLKLVIQDFVGVKFIALRNIYMFSRQYAASGQITSTIINNPVGLVSFQVQQLIPVSTNIIHQYSYDNVHFTVMNLGSITFTQPYWYRALLSRTTTSTASNGLASTLPNSTNYQVSNSTIISLGSNITEVTIAFTTVSGPVTLGDVPLPNSLIVKVGSVILTAGQYTFTSNTVTLASPQSNVTIIYQTSGLNSQVLSSLQNYITPILTEIVFEA